MIRFESTFFKKLSEKSKTKTQIQLAQSGVHFKGEFVFKIWPGKCSSPLFSEIKMKIHSTYFETWLDFSVYYDHKSWILC